MHNFLLPNRYKKAGAVFLVAGFAGLVYYTFSDFRLMLPVFAIFSSFLETKAFTVVQTNLADELILLCLLTGCFFVVFSKEKNENEQTNLIRFQALWWSILANIFLQAISVIFLYGSAFMAILFLNLFSVFLFYFCFFFFMKRREHKRNG